MESLYLLTGLVTAISLVLMVTTAELSHRIRELEDQVEWIQDAFLKDLTTTE